jgi:arsenate reductase
MVKVLFVCIHNSARSQMAETFLNDLGKGLFIAESAGLEAGTLNPVVVEAMAELGYDISGNATKSVFDFYQEGRTYQAVIKVCDQINGERCPIFPQTLINENWNLEDPSAIEGDASAKLQRTREIRDQIIEKVNDFIARYQTFAQNRKDAE